MSVLRVVAAIVVGYLVFAAASMMLVGAVMVRGGPVFMVLALAALALVGVASGLVATLIAGGNRLLAAAILAGLIAVVTSINLLLGLGAEPLWYKIGTILLIPSSILLVGWRQARR